MRVTIRDIANRAGVSVSTASRALNDKPDVSVGTRARVLAAAQELDYTVNVYARALVGGRSRTLGLIIPDSGEPFFAQLARGVADVATSHGYSIIVHNTNERPEFELQAHHMLLERRVEGILIGSVQSGPAPLRRLIEAGVFCLLLNRRLDNMEVDYVLSDYQYGAYEATVHLCALGHTRIAHITGADNRFSVQERLIGYHRALAAHGIHPDPALVLRCQADLDSVYALVLRALPRISPRPTAIFAYNDKYCIAVLKALNDLGWRVPDDVALVGYDDLEYARFLQPPLTTIAQSPYDVGKIGTEILIERLEQPEGPQSMRHVILKPELRIRASSQPPVATRVSV